MGDPLNPSLSADEALTRLGGIALSEHSLSSVLQTVADLTKRVVPGDIEASVSVLVADKPQTVATTGQLATDLDESQYGRGYGPCLHAASAGEAVEVTDARTETRWPDYMQVAVERGWLSSLSIPLGSPEQLAAALNVYARQPSAFTEDSRIAAGRFARFAGVALTHMYAYQNARQLADHLERAMESRAVIDQAKGILMERHKLTPDEAFHTLAQASMHTNRKVRDLAEHLVRTGELPTRPARPH